MATAKFNGLLGVWGFNAAQHSVGARGHNRENPLNFELDCTEASYDHYVHMRRQPRRNQKLGKPIGLGIDSGLGAGPESVYSHRPLSSSLLGLPYRILKLNHKTELLRGLWVLSSKLC